MSEDLTHSMLHEMSMKKFNLEPNFQLNLLFKLSSFDYTIDITDDAENGLSFYSGQNDFQINESMYTNEPHFTNPESSFVFKSNNEYADDGVDENPQNNIHKWNKFMSFKPDIPDTPVYKSKPIILKKYSQQSEVKKGKNFDNKEALILAVRLKALNDGFQFVVDRSAPERVHLKCYNFNQCDWKLRARLWDNTEKYHITHLDDVHTCPKTQTYPNHQNANKKIWGSPYEAFEMLPYYCYNLERKNEGTVTRIKTYKNGVFEMLLIAIGASIRTFCNYLWPVLMIDATHLKGLYKGTNLVARAMDGNSQIVPIDFGIFKGETVEKEFLLPFHAHDAYLKLCEAGVERWSRAHCPLVRYNYMTSNSVESVNAKSVIHRKEPVLKLAETYRAMVQEWYYKRRQLAGVNNYQYEVSDGQYIRAVNLHTGICECQKWQLSEIPCGHVIAVTRWGLSPLVIAEQQQDATNIKEKQGKPSCAKKLFD
ncbi:transposase, MuDR, MULE transposase domain protein [Tanacetum coccineum]